MTSSAGVTMTPTTGASEVDKLIAHHRELNTKEFKTAVKKIESDLGLPAACALVKALVDQCLRARSEIFTIELRNWPDDKKDLEIAAIELQLQSRIIQLAADAWCKRPNK